MLWKNHIDAEVIDMFLDRLFEHCGRSFFDFERVLKDYGMEGKKIPFLFSPEDCTEDCTHLSEQDEEIDDLKEKVRIKTKDSRRNRDLYVKEKAKFKKFKENAVLFTMDDEGF